MAKTLVMVVDLDKLFRSGITLQQLINDSRVDLDKRAGVFGRDGEVYGGYEVQDVVELYENCDCGHQWVRHHFAVGCLVKVDGGGSYCSCVKPRP